MGGARTRPLRQVPPEPSGSPASLNPGTWGFGHFVPSRKRHLLESAPF